MKFWVNRVKPAQKISDKGKCMETAECISFGYFIKLKHNICKTQANFFFENSSYFHKKTPINQKNWFFGKSNLTSIFWNGKT